MPKPPDTKTIFTKPLTEEKKYSVKVSCDECDYLKRDIKGGK